MSTTQKPAAVKLTPAQLEVIVDLALTYGISVGKLYKDAVAGRIEIDARRWHAPRITIKRAE